MTEKCKIVGVIPCRYAAVRFPGKPLADISGKPMMWHVYQASMRASILEKVYIATEDDRIFNVARDLGMNVLMTSKEHPTGGDRVAECAREIDAEIYVNVQGDEPMIEPEAITQVTQALVDCRDDSTIVTNAYAPFDRASDIIDTNNVKVVMTKSKSAMAFSRLPIPYPRTSEVTYNRQLGLYAFRRKALELFSKTKPSPIEMAEGVEMYRFLENDYRILMVEVEDKSIPVDTVTDLERVRKMMSR